MASGIRVKEGALSMQSGWQGLCSWQCNRGFCPGRRRALALLSLPARRSTPGAAVRLPEAHPAAFFRQMDGGLVQCQLVPGTARFFPATGGMRRPGEPEGKYYSLVYGNPCAVHLDPIEKKPSFNILPGACLFPSPRRVATSTARSVRIGKSPDRPEKTYNFDLPG